MKRTWTGRRRTATPAQRAAAKRNLVKARASRWGKHGGRAGSIRARKQRRDANRIVSSLNGTSGRQVTTRVVTRKGVLTTTRTGGKQTYSKYKAGKPKWLRYPKGYTWADRVR